jgi:hypothetical protein
MGYGQIAARQIASKVDMAQAGLISEADARQQSEQLLANLSDTDRQEALTVLRQQAQNR